ncbi:MAG: aromatic amino acid lyase [Nakamurella multipartita]
MTSPLQIGTQPLTQADVVAVVRHARPVVLGPDALAAMAASRAVVDTLAGDAHPHYGISTGFGALATTSIPPSRRTALQQSLIRSHAGRAVSRSSGRWSAA